MSEIVVNEVSKSIYGVPIINSISMKLVSGNVYGFQGITAPGNHADAADLRADLSDKGEIIIDGKRLGKEITFPQSVGLLLENPAFLDSYTGYENLEMLASIKNIITREEIHEAITSVGLDPLDKRKYKKFSLGMKQRLGIAAAIMEKPDILILDEPTNSLDSGGVSLVKTIIAKERERGAIIILACHDLPVLQDVSDEIFLLEQGKITEHLYKPF